MYNRKKDKTGVIFSMYQIDFKHPNHVYFMGIGGISMSGFAELLHSIGFTVSGSDSMESSITEHLESLGIHVIYGQVRENITNDIDLVVYTAAIHPDNPEFMAAKELGIPMMDRAEMVGQVMKNYENAIAVSGTHGKTTTTSMISHILLAANLDPTISVGGILKAIHGNMRIGASQNFVTEACEYTNSFLKFKPRIGIILNIEEDHMDFFKDINDIRNSFHQFALLLPENGFLILNGNIDRIEEITDGIACPYVTYGVGNGSYNYRADNIAYDEFGCASYDLIINDRIEDRIVLSVPGVHNVENSLAAIALAKHLMLHVPEIQKGLSEFKGTDRRFEYKGSVGGVTIIDDYAHHPTEIEATLKVSEKYPHKHLWCVFQPHTYTRTKAFLKDFARALSHAEHVILADIYAAREIDTGEISSLDLKRELEALGAQVSYFPSFGEIEDFLLENCTSGDLVITMGAGNVVEIGEDLLGISAEAL
jgi:UDP-N-acetylmuramate--alanine ligase